MAYIRLPKELLSSEMWMYELNNDTKIFFIHLLSKATHKRCRATFLGEIFDLEAGEVVITQRKLANTLNISENNVRKHISTLISKELITTKVTQSVRGGYAENFKNRRTVITISNTDNYTGTTDPIGATSESDDEQNIYAFYRKEEIKEFNNKKKGAQKELSQEVDLVEMVELVPSHPEHSNTVYFHEWISSLSEQLDMSIDQITQLVAMFARHKLLEGNKRLPVTIFRYHCKLFIKEKYPTRKTKNNEEETKQPNYEYRNQRIPRVEDLPDFHLARSARARAIAAGCNDGPLGLVETHTV